MPSSIAEWKAAETSPCGPNDSSLLGTRHLPAPVPNFPPPVCSHSYLRPRVCCCGVPLRAPSSWPPGGTPVTLTAGQHAGRHRVRN